LGGGSGGGDSQRARMEASVGRGGVGGWANIEIIGRSDVSDGGAGASGTMVRVEPPFAPCMIDTEPEREGVGLCVCVCALSSEAAKVFKVCTACRYVSSCVSKALEYAASGLGYAPPCTLWNDGAPLLWVEKGMACDGNPCEGKAPWM
jgi:hypothetical protein